MVWVSKDIICNHTLPLDNRQLIDSSIHFYACNCFGDVFAQYAD